MSEAAKLSDSHRSRAAVIYVRQSTLAQVERNTDPGPASLTWWLARASWAGHAARSAWWRIRGSRRR